MMSKWTRAIIFSVAFHVVLSADCGGKPMCTPNAWIFVDCNSGICNAAGDKFELSSKMFCGPLECVNGQEKMERCNNCVCCDGMWICSHNECDDFDLN